MTWFLFALICTLGWGFADLFYKHGTDESDGQSHLKLAVWVGMVMGIVALILIPFSETGMDFPALLTNAGKYTPASLAYIVSMIIGYAGLRYIELSIISPVQNASGALSMLAMITFFVVTGNSASIEVTPMDVIGTALIIAGVISLAFVEQRLSKREAVLNAEPENRKYRFGALALLFPVLYCVFDTIGTAADGIILDEEAGLGLGEIDVLILYGLTFLLVGIGCWIYMLIRNKKPYNPFARTEWPKAVAAVCEEFGQVFYVYAMADNPVLAAPMISAYCIVSVVLSRIALKEKMKLSQYLCVAAVIAGIVLLGIAEGLAEA